jgi:hypothetical protein
MYPAISEPKGLPEDFTLDFSSGKMKLHNGEPVGSYDHSWFTLAELDAFDWNQVVKCSGIVMWDVYVERRMKNITGKPETYWDISDAIVMSDEEAGARYGESWTPSWMFPEYEDAQVRIWWDVVCKDASKEFYNRILGGLRALDVPSDKVRIVFGFT